MKEDIWYPIFRQPIQLTDSLSEFEENIGEVIDSMRVRLVAKHPNFVCYTFKEVTMPSYRLCGKCHCIETIHKYCKYKCGRVGFIGDPFIVFELDVNLAKEWMERTKQEEDSYGNE